MTSTLSARPDALSARPDAVLPPDAEEIMDRALAEEGPPEIPGVNRLHPRELRFQRRMTVLFTVGPLIGVVLAMTALWGTGISGIDLGLFLGFYFLTGLGVTVGFHRLFTHRGFEVPKAVRAILAVTGSMAVQGAVIQWVATHRRHHAYADAYGDPHSPHLVQGTGLGGVLRGLWHAHIGWFLDGQVTEPSRWAPDLQEDPVIHKVDRLFPQLVLVSFFLPPVIGFLVTGTLWGAITAFLWGSLVRIFLLHHVTWSINSVCHFFGSQPFEARDESRNNWPMILVAFGESWHNNHHAFPTSARHGLLVGQFDLSWVVIRTMKWLRLARNVRLPSPQAIAKKWAGAPKRLARW